MSGPLDGITILSMAEQYPGPFCTALLGDMGARVVLLERPGRGDPARRTWIWRALARNKESVTVDLKRDGGPAVVHRLAKIADVFVEGFRPGVSSRLGVDYPSLSKRNPGLIYCSISGYGQTGRLKSKPAHDLTFQAMSGMLAKATAQDDVEVPPVALADLSSGLFAALGIVAALRYREVTGKGQYIDVAMAESVLSLMSVPITAALNTGSGQNQGTIRGWPEYGVYACKDGSFTLSIAGEEHFRKNLFLALGRPDLAEMDFQSRLERREEIRSFLQRRFADMTRAELEAFVNEHDVAGGPVMKVEETANHDYLSERDIVHTATTQEGDSTRYVRTPLLFSLTPVEISSAEPALGEHTTSVLASAGFSREEIETLRQRGVFGTDLDT